MQIILTPTGRKSAYVLIFTLFFLAASLTVFIGLLDWSSSTSKVTARNNQYFMSEAAAEAAAERMLSEMNRDFLSQTVTNASYYASLRPTTNGWPISYQFSDITVSIGSQSANQVPLGKQFQ